jgi:hypothetical protein
MLKQIYSHDNARDQKKIVVAFSKALSLLHYNNTELNCKPIPLDANPAKTGAKNV